MKELKSLLGLFVLITVCVQSQGQLNYLSSEERQSLKINEVSFQDIENTRGKVSLLKELFGVPKGIEEGEGGMEENWRSISFDNIIISFNNVDLENLQAFIYYINAESITVKGKKISIGDPITNLGSDVIFNTRKDNEKSVLFDWGSCCTFIIEFDQASMRVTEITYHVWT